jgi:hypothetical protein
MKRLAKCVVVLAVVASLGGCSSGSTASLFNQLGGMDTVSKLASSFLGDATKNPQLSGLLGGANTSAVAPQLSNQLCATLGGGCKAPLTDDQVKAAGAKVSPEQNKALSDTLTGALKTIGAQPAVSKEITTLLGPKLGGIVAGLL